MSSQERTSAAGLSSDCEPASQQARQDALEAAYEADGRHDPAHPQHGLYTGLMVVEEPQPTIEDQLADWWRSSYPKATLNAQTAALMAAFGAWLLEQRKG